MQEGAIKPMVELLRSPNHKVVEQAAVTLRNLSVNGIKNAKRLNLQMPIRFTLEQMVPFRHLLLSCVRLKWSFKSKLQLFLEISLSLVHLSGLFILIVQRTMKRS